MQESPVNNPHDWCGSVNMTIRKAAASLRVLAYADKVSFAGKSVAGPRDGAQKTLLATRKSAAGLQVSARTKTYALFANAPTIHPQHACGGHHTLFI